MLGGAKAFLDQVNRHGRLHYFTCFFASYASILSSNDGFGELFEDLLLHEMDIFLLDCWTSYVSFVESIETCQKKSSN